MAVVKNIIADQIYTFMKASAGKTKENSDEAMREFADNMAIVIKDAILSAQVNQGITVSVTGSAVAQTGATTSPGTLS